MSDFKKFMKEYEDLKAYKKIVQKYVKGMIKELKIIDESESDFEKKIISFYGLNTVEDKKFFLRIMLNETSLKYFNEKKHQMETINHGENMGS